MSVAKLRRARGNPARALKHTRATGRDTRGRFIAGHPGPRLTTGQYSQLVRSGAATGQTDVLATARLQLRGELGDIGVIKGELADSFVELAAVRNYLGDRLGAEGPLTSQGRTRALLRGYLAIVDRQVRLAQVLGLERHRPAPSLAVVLAEAEGRR